MRVLVCGGRDWTDGPSVYRCLSEVHWTRPITLIVEGGQRTIDPLTKEIIGGADYWANRWAHSVGVPVVTVEAEWKKYGRRAGPLRNQRMLDEERPDMIVAFPGGRGTADMVKRARTVGIDVLEPLIPVMNARPE